MSKWKATHAAQTADRMMCMPLPGACATCKFNIQVSSAATRIPV
jgi:hypothetical protein